MLRNTNSLKRKKIPSSTTQTKKGSNAAQVKRNKRASTKQKLQPLKGIKVMCWNVQNLTNKVSYRQGTFPCATKGVDMIFRLEEVAKWITKNYIDIAFILEAGPDAPYVCGELSGLLSKLAPSEDYGVNCSGDSGGKEQYILVYNSKNLKPFNISSTLIAANDKFRKAYHVQIQVGPKTIHFLVLHAPSGGNLNVIKKRIESSPPSGPVIFCGDLNIVDTGKSDIKHNPYQGLKKKLNDLNFSHEGPFDLHTGGPALTSLRTLKTIVGSGDSQSHAYDQVWVRDGAPVQDKVSVLDCTAMRPALHRNIAQEMIYHWLLADIENIKTDTQPHSYPTRIDPNTAVQIQKRLQEAINTFIAIKNELKEFEGKKNQDPLRLHPAVVQLVTDSLAKAKKIHKNHQNLIEHHQIKQSEYSVAAAELITFNRRAKVVLGYYDMVCERGSGGVFSEEASVFQRAISDHVPVTWTVAWK